MTDRIPDEPKAKRQTEIKNIVANVDVDSMRCLMESNKSSCEIQICKKALSKAESTSSDMKRNKKGKERNDDEFWKITSDILQGEHLLHRLQLVQQHQEADMHPCQEGDHEKKCFRLLTEDLETRKGGQSSEDDAIHSDKRKINPLEKEIIDEKISGKAMPAQSEHDMTKKKADIFCETPGVRECTDWIPINFDETICNVNSFPSSCHRHSVTETTMERRIHEDTQGKPNLQRAAGILNLADDPDILEIPFNTNIEFELHATKTFAGQDYDCLLLKQKMSQDTNLQSQKSPGSTENKDIQKGFKEADSHQLKERKLLFEAFQQDNSQGPTRLRKSLLTSTTNQVYPTVLERTRSLDIFSILEKQKSCENLHTKMPSGGSRDKRGLSPYAKQEKNVRLYRSSDSVGSTQVTENTSSVEMDKVKLEDPLLKQNPFFKLRPALGLKPEVEKEIREAEEREDELRRQRSTIYGDKRQSTKEVDKHPNSTSTHIPGSSTSVKPITRS
ncbi:uncharacterized protein LOC144208451 isoform X2 [Stigmatopora nigra]